MRGFMRRAQSVLDFAEETLRFAVGCFRKEMILISLSVSVSYGYRHSCQPPKGDKALFPIVKAIIFIGEGESLEHTRRINEVEAVFVETNRTFALGP
jgi:hypothetical protein